MQLDHGAGEIDISEGIAHRKENPTFKAKGRPCRCFLIDSSKRILRLACAIVAHWKLPETMLGAVVAMSVEGLETHGLLWASMEAVAVFTDVSPSNWVTNAHKTYLVSRTYYV